MPAGLAIDDLDACPATDFVTAVAPLFEGAPRLLERLAAARPFGSLAALFARARTIAHAMPLDDQIELIDAHPRLGAPPATVSTLSFREQGYDRAVSTADATTTLAAELEQLNAAYEARFGFRYCVFVAGRSRGALIPGMEAALTADRATEIHRALDAVVDIAAARHSQLEAAP